MSRPRILLLSGVNLGLLGERQPEIYGSTTLADHAHAAEKEAASLGMDLEHVESDSQTTLVKAIHAARPQVAAIIINPGAFTHYAWAIHDALAAFDGPVVELHLSNPDGREPWRRTSVISPVATGTISGFGGDGYRLAVRAVADLINAKK